MFEFISNFALIAVVAASLFVSTLYLVRVVRHRRDPLRWLLLGLLMSLALTNAPILLHRIDYTLPLWVGWGTRLAAAIIVIWTAKPLMVDTWREIQAFRRVAVDSWRVMSQNDNEKSTSPKGRK